MLYLLRVSKIKRSTVQFSEIYFHSLCARVFYVADKTSLQRQVSMDKRVYGVVMICPAICIYLCLYSLFFLLCFKCPDILINISTSSFTKVLYYSVEGRKKKLYFLSLQITDRNLAIELSCLLFSTLITLITVTSVVFLTFLLVEISYECTEGFECFKSRELRSCHI